MTLDLSKAQSGDVVEFANGGKATIEECKVNGEFVSVTFKEFKDSRTWYKSGLYDETDGKPFIIDIISITPKPFDWKDVKAGMAFRCNHFTPARKGVMWYVGDHLCDETLIVAAYGEDGSAPYDGYDKSSLVRAPEHDIQP